MQKTKRFNFRITATEDKIIRDKAKKAGLSLTDYIVRCCTGKQIVVIEGFDEVIKQQKALGKNLNRLTVLANMGKATFVNLEETVKQFAEINLLIKNVLEKRR